MLKKLVAALLFVCPLVFANWVGGLKKPSTREIDGKEFYEIATPENLAWFVKNVNEGNMNWNAILVDDIIIWEDSVTTETMAWTPIAPDVTVDTAGYRGIFDGNGHKISGIYIPPNYCKSGFFGTLSQLSVVKNLTIENAWIQSSPLTVSHPHCFAGGIAGVFGGDSIVNCEVHGLIGDDYAGGIVGFVDNIRRPETDFKPQIRNCRNYAKVLGLERAGGIVGDVSGNGVYINDCVNKGRVQGLYVGGIVGTPTSVTYMDSCVNDGEIWASETNGIAGGLVGSSGATVYINHSVNNGSVYSAELGSMGFIAGGFVGDNGYPLTIQNSVNNGLVTRASRVKKSGYAGGFVGRLASKATISNCVNRGHVEGFGYSGGFVGLSDSMGVYTLKNSVNEGAIGNDTSRAYNGGFIGFGAGKWLLEGLLNKSNLYGQFVGGIIAYFRAMYHTGVVYDVVPTYSVFKLRNSLNEGQLSCVSCDREIIGGMIGYVERSSYSNTDHVHEIYNAVNRGRIVIHDNDGFIGGIVGRNEDSELQIRNSINYGSIEMSTTSKVSFMEAYIGGIIGYDTKYASVYNSENYGDISYVNEFGGGYEVAVGGLCGRTSYVQGSVNYGNISAKVVGESRYVYVGGVMGDGSSEICINKGRVELIGNERISTPFAAGISGNGFATGCLNEGTVIHSGAMADSMIASISRGSTLAYGGSYSLADSIVINGTLVSGVFPGTCNFVSKEVLGFEEPDNPNVLSAKEMQTIEFAYRMNTCVRESASKRNYGIWTQYGNAYPVFADEEHHGIYKVWFLDSAKILNVNTYKIDSSLTDASGRVINVPSAPDPSDADDRYKFGYWSLKKSMFFENRIINDDDNIYAVYVNADADEPEHIIFEVDGKKVADYIFDSVGTAVSLPSAEKSGQSFKGWYNNGTLIGKAGATTKFSEPMVLEAQYEKLQYTVTFLNQEVELQVDTLAYGAVPEYKGKTPEYRNAKFLGWTPEIQPVTANFAYFAMFDSVGLGESSSSTSELSSSAVSSSSKVKSSSSVASSSSSEKSSSSVIPSSSSKKASNSSSSLGDETSSSSKAKSSSSAKTSSSAKSSSSSKANSSSSKAKSSSSKGTDIVRNVVQPTFNLAVNGMTLTLSNTQGGIVRIFDALGHLVAAKPVTGLTTSITLQTPGNYNVRMNGISRSVTLK